MSVLQDAKRILNTIIPVLLLFILPPLHCLVHIVLEVKNPKYLAKFMQGLNLSYATWFNRKYKKNGHL